MNEESNLIKQLYRDDSSQKLLEEAPWKEDSKYFNRVDISISTINKMMKHCISGGSIEVMGLLLGYIKEKTYVIIDSFALPVEGTETRVNAAAEANVFMTQYIDHLNKLGRRDKPIGWYHSHPGYGCWLSGIDVQTQQMHQTYQDPWIAIVIDPIRTSQQGKLEIGAFRTFPENTINSPEDNSDDFNVVIPSEKRTDYGFHRNQYYSIDVNMLYSEEDKQFLNRHFLQENWMDFIFDHDNSEKLLKEIETRNEFLKENFLTTIPMEDGLNQNFEENMSEGKLSQILHEREKKEQEHNEMEKKIELFEKISDNSNLDIHLQMNILDLLEK
ncbi:hypothetical protein SNEBB_006365 [Seison nebaliae]|nr:hypothetical protein SNEBB_006365 [Seison nebaliae]